MMPQGAKDSRSHACMEERLPLAPAPHEEGARRADSEWAGISKKSQGASSVAGGHTPTRPRGRSPQRATSKWGLHSAERGHPPHPAPPPRKEFPYVLLDFYAGNGSVDSPDNAWLGKEFYEKGSGRDKSDIWISYRHVYEEQGNLGICS